MELFGFLREGAVRTAAYEAVASVVSFRRERFAANASTAVDGVKKNPEYVCGSPDSCPGFIVATSSCHGSGSNSNRVVGRRYIEA